MNAECFVDFYDVSIASPLFYASQARCVSHRGLVILFYETGKKSQLDVSTANEYNVSGVAWDSNCCSCLPAFWISNLFLSSRRGLAKLNRNFQFELLLNVNKSHSAKTNL